MAAIEHNAQSVQGHLPAMLKSRRMRTVFLMMFLFCVVMYTLSLLAIDIHDYSSPQHVYEKLKNGTFYHSGDNYQEHHGIDHITLPKPVSSASPDDYLRTHNGKVKLPGMLQSESSQQQTPVYLQTEAVGATSDQMKPTSAPVSRTTQLSDPSSITSSANLDSTSTVPNPLPTYTDHVNNDTEIDWSSFAYVQYVTNPTYLCNSLMILESLYRLGTQADLVMLYPRQWKVPALREDAETPESSQLAKARDEYGAKLVPIEVQSYDRGDITWTDSFTKLLLFNQTQYKRVIHLDSDGTVKKPMDELFHLPSAACAMPRGYWLDPIQLASIIIVAEPSAEEFARIQDYINTHEDSGFDMDIMDSIYHDSALIFPHRNYLLLTGEFRGDQHAKYLGNEYEEWNATKAVEETRYIHWSEWPLPKPWIRPHEVDLKNKQPKCHDTDKEGEDCRNRDAYLALREDFTRRRKEVCGREFDHEDRAKRSMGTKR
ncbi:unnamed protein product [Periconia digitata]|uniref:Nucleotide-diphospho-sugar transferase n=1 Tax=Periconia digitata TaxID=1303443 RepID=A0A9W4UD76_9PLEO|nr:unnamed protein product [Periconia digitata]